MGVYSTDPAQCAAQLLDEAHGGKFNATDATSGALGVLTNLIAWLKTSGLSFDKIVAFAKTIVPLVLSKDWMGIIQAVIGLFATTPAGPAIQQG